MFTTDALFAFLLTLMAGLATGIGSILSLFTKRNSTKFLAISLGFSAGVMIYVSFIEILPKAQDSLTSYMGEEAGAWATAGGFFFGIILIALIDRFVPESSNPHEVRKVSLTDVDDKKKRELMRMGVITALAVAIHNFPEGIATFTAALNDPELGVPIAIAIALHNIPEGVAVAVPIYFATGDKKRAFKLSFLSGLSEPIGALIGYVVLFNFLNDAVFGFIFASVAGIMVFISLDELLPSAREYGESHLSIYGLIAGMMVMATSLLLF